MGRGGRQGPGAPGGGRQSPAGSKDLGLEGPSEPSCLSAVGDLWPAVGSLSSATSWALSGGGLGGVLWQVQGCGWLRKVPFLELGEPWGLSEPADPSDYGFLLGGEEECIIPNRGGLGLLCGLGDGSWADVGQAGPYPQSLLCFLTPASKERKQVHPF